MHKKKSILGFTLVELMVALFLFATLGVVGFNFLKSSMDSTMKLKTQQIVNENAKNLLKIVTNDLKSSSVMNYRIPYNSTKASKQAYSYPSSVIFPAINQYSTTGVTSATYNNEKMMSFSHDNDGGFSGVDTMRNNQNRFLFYTKSMIQFNAALSSNAYIQIVEYRVIYENGKCRVNRIDYNVGNSTNSLTEWPAIDLITNNVAPYSVSGDVEFSPTLFKTCTVRNSDTLLSLPNRGDVVLLYVNRAFDDSQTQRKFAANQYNVKVMIFQTMKDIDFDIITADTTDGTTVYKVNNSFTDIFLHDQQNEDNNTLRKRRRENYRYAELTSSVGVFAPSSN